MAVCTLFLISTVSFNSVANERHSVRDIQRHAGPVHADSWHSADGDARPRRGGGAARSPHTVRNYRPHQLWHWSGTVK